MNFGLGANPGFQHLITILMDIERRRSIYFWEFWAAHNGHFSQLSIQKQSIFYKISQKRSLCGKNVSNGVLIKSVILYPPIRYAKKLLALNS